VTVRIWVPQGLRRKDPSSLAYVVIDELDSGLAGLTVSPWPTLDGLGRLRFDLDASRSVGADARVLLAFLRVNRTPKKHADRELRIGDVFAVRLREAISDSELADPAAWMIPPVSDVSRQAREVGKVAYLAAAAPTVAPRTPISDLAPKSEPLRATSVARRPDPFRE